MCAKLLYGLEAHLTDQHPKYMGGILKVDEPCLAIQSIVIGLVYTP